MVKKLLCVCLVWLLLLPGAALAESRVFDNADLFTAAEILDMEAYIAQIRTDYQMDVAVLTSNDVPLNRTASYADNYYEEQGFGVGADHSGMLLLIDMSNRELYISTEGRMIDYITDSRLDKLLDAGYNELSRGRYGSGAMSVLNLLNTYLDQGRERGSYRYDAVTGQRLTNEYNPLTFGEIMLALIVAIAAAGIFMASVSASYQLKGGAYRYGMDGNVARVLTRDEEHFVTQHVTRRVNQPTPPAGHHSSGSHHSSGRGSAVHHSSSGRTHGGGGRKF